MSLDISAVASRCQIVTLRTGDWRPTRLHKPVSAEVNAKHGCIDNAAKVMVTVCKHPALERIGKLHQQAYDIHTKFTRPTIQDGMRLLPFSCNQQHANELGAIRAEFQTEVDNFLAMYESEKAQAPLRLNGLYDASCWPTLEAVTGKFRLSVDYLPCPTEGAWREWLTVSVEAAQLELRESLEQAIKRVAERCASDGRLYQTVFSNLKELLALVPDLDLAADPKLREIAKQAEALANQDKDQVTASPILRKKLADQANNLASMFGGIK